MVFTRLSAQEKDAFFGLLDEYFQFRPELFERSRSGQGASGLAGTGVSTATAASIVQHALSASKTTGATGSAGASSAKSNNPYNMIQPHDVDATQLVKVGRVAAASLAFSGGNAGGPPVQLAKPGGDLPSLPRRAASTAPVERTTTPGIEVDKLVTKKTSVFSAFKKHESAGGVAIPPAFATPKNTYGPPPVRRVTSDTSTSTSTSTSAGGAVVSAFGAHAQRLVPPAPTQPDSAEEGVWAEVLYDYSSEDPGDLAIEAGTRVLITDKSSDDWWTGQVDGQGRQGLFPASYVKLL